MTNPKSEAIKHLERARNHVLEAYHEAAQDDDIDEDELWAVSNEISWLINDIEEEQGQ